MTNFAKKLERNRFACVTPGPILTAIVVAGCILVMLSPQAASAATAKSKYFQAEASYNTLKKSKKKFYRHHWLACIKKFQGVYTHDPDGPWAAAGLYKSGQLYYQLYRYSGREADKKEAQDIFERVVKRFPKSRYKARANSELQAIYSSNLKKMTAAAESRAKTLPKTVPAVKKTPPAPPVPVPEKKAVPASADGLVTISGLRYWSNPNYTRIVIDADASTAYTHRLLKKDPAIKKPQRLYVDLESSRLATNLPKIIPINDNLLSDARAGQYTTDAVRVVVDIKSFDTYKIFSLRNPFRIVVDVWGKTAAAYETASVPPGSAGSGKKMGTSALARQLALGVSRIVIDPGHGGKDFGAPGYLKGVHEKNVVLTIAKVLAKKIKRELGCEVIMTREHDKYLTLEERTAIANTNNADLFISVHTNSHRDRRAYGIETYFLNLATDNEAILVAARENATSTKNISDLQTILNDLMHNAKVNESSRLAAHVQNSVYKGLKKKYDRIKNKGVKQAPFYVLLGAQMPAILVETSFISNSRECKRLVNATYVGRLTDSIVKGVARYIKETNPTAFFKEPRPGGRQG